MQVPFVELKTQYAALQHEIEAAMTKVFAQSQFILGPEVEEFEQKFAAYCQVQHAIAVNSGTSALHLALIAAGIKPHDEVITVAMTFVATVAPILYCGAKPVLIDVNPITWNLDPSQLEDAITPRTKAIIPVHLHGLMADMGPIMKVANHHNITVIEDACQAHGATYQGKTAGSIGKINAFSFYPGKNLGAYGEGGAVVTQDSALAEEVRLLRNFGQAEKYHHILKGFNYRMETLQAAILSVKMKYIDQWIQQRIQVAQWYYERLTELPLQLPYRPTTDRHGFHVFAIRTSHREMIKQALANRGIATQIHYPTPVHLQAAYADLGYGKGSLPVSEQLAQEFLSLPLYPEMTETQVDYVCEQLQQIIAKQPTVV